MSDAPRIHIFDGPYVTVAGERRDIPEGSKRLVVLAALTPHSLERRHAAGLLWPNGSDARAAGNLRSSLWRLRGAGIDVLHCDKWTLGLRSGVVVDAVEADAWAERVISGHPDPDDVSSKPWFAPALDLLPGWYDDWVLAEHERSRERMLRALVALGRLLVETGRHAEAVDVAMLVTGRDPLRESAQRLLVEAHLAEGNHGVAWRVYAGYRDLLYDELGAEPSPEFSGLLHPPQRPVSDRDSIPVRMSMTASP